MPPIFIADYAHTRLCRTNFDVSSAGSFGGRTPVVTHRVGLV